MGTRRAVAWAGLALAVGCSFDQSGAALEDGGVGVVDAIDGSTFDDGGRPDAGPCLEPRVVISVNGVTAAPGVGEPFTRVLVGDTVELDATGSCSPSGINSIQWQISPIDSTRDTALPNLQAEVVTVYPMDARQYTVSLTVRGADGRMHADTVYAFESHGFQELPGIGGSGDTRGLSVSDDHLWVAAKDGPYRASLTNLSAGFADVNSFAVGETISTELQVVHYDANANNVWFAHKDARDTVFKLDMSPALPSVSSVVFSTALTVSTEVEDISSANPGVDLATKFGVVTSTDNLTFPISFQVGAPFHATARGDGEHWVGGLALYDADTGSNVVDVLGNGTETDDKIRAMAIDDILGHLWVASEDKFVVRVNNETGAVIDRYIHSNSDLVDAKMTDVAIELTGRARGDVWVATDKGLARFKQDRQRWVFIGAPQGLGMLTNVRSVVIDQANGRRAIFGGTSKGVVYSRVP